MSPAKRSPAHTASRQRMDHSQENAEDYVELIFLLQEEHGAAHKTDLADRLGVSHVTVHKTIKRLCGLGLVHAEAYRAVSLTAKGRQMAAEARERHALVLRFLEHLGVGPAAAGEDAEGLEHHICPETLQCIERFCRTMEKTGEYKRPRSRAK